MNDRFKFRIWHEPLKQMHYNDFILTATGYLAPIYQQDDYMMKFNQCDLEFDKQCQVMQCTGLKDKNGKLIYEGDVVNGSCGVYWGKMIVEYNVAGFVLNKKGKRLNFLDGDNFIEVIGNIYENKELLEEE